MLQHPDGYHKPPSMHAQSDAMPAMNQFKADCKNKNDVLSGCLLHAFSTWAFDFQESSLSKEPYRALQGSLVAGSSPKISVSTSFTYAIAELPAMWGGACQLEHTCKLVAIQVDDLQLSRRAPLRRQWPLKRIVGHVSAGIARPHL